MQSDEKAAVATGVSEQPIENPISMEKTDPATVYVEEEDDVRTDPFPIFP